MAVQPLVRLRDPAGRVHDVPRGGLIGRMGGAALRLDDPRISEAHAMVSLRGGSLVLLALRGRFAVDGKPVPTLPLRTGQQIFFARDLALEVVDVVLPDHVVALEVQGVGRHVLAGVVSLLRRPEPTLVARYEADAVARFWNHDDVWRAQLGDAPARDIAPGDVLDVDGIAVKVVRVGTRTSGTQATRHLGGIAGALRIVASYDTVQIHQDGEPALVLNGNHARLVSELVAFGGPVAWDVLAVELWGDLARLPLRGRLDQNLLRLRRKLEAAGVRSDLVRADGTGNLELVLAEGDVVEDNQ